MRTLVIGDVHGCIDEFRELVGMAEPGDRIVQVGDLMDRGPAPAECVRFARERGIECVLGNHDEKHLRWRRYERRRKAGGAKNPMRPLSPEARAENALLSDDDEEWISEMPSMIDVGSRVAVHAGLEPGLLLSEQRAERMIRVRYVNPATGMMVSNKDGNWSAPPNSVPWHSLWAGRGVVFGHAVQGYRPKIYGACVGVDTGCCYGGRLTAAVIEDGVDLSFLSVPAARVYYDRHIPPMLREEEKGVTRSVD